MGVVFERRQRLAEMIAANADEDGSCPREALRCGYAALGGQKPPKRTPSQRVQAQGGEGLIRVDSQTKRAAQQFHSSIKGTRWAVRDSSSSQGRRSSIDLQSDLTWLERCGAIERVHDRDAVRVVDWVKLLVVIRGERLDGH